MNRVLFQALVGALDGPCTAQALLERIATMDGAEPTALATFYRALNRAVDEGWLEIETETDAGGRPGRPGQRYRLTDDGRIALRREARNLDRLASIALAATATESES